MGKSKKKFIDKNSAVTFHLVHRSQRDPLITDENAPQHVLVEAGPTQNKQKVIENTKTVEEKQKQVEEQKKYGVFFDDDYNYLQHLRTPGQQVVDWEKVEPGNKKNKEKSKKTEKPALQLPSSVFASEFEEKEGMLRKAAPRSGPRLDWDPEIVAALDDDYDFEDPENALDENFIDMAMGSEEDECEEGDGDDEWSDIDSNDADNGQLSEIEENDDGEEGRDTIGPLKRNRRFSEEETKSRFTDYSISSSAIRRNEQLTLLDDRFEKFYENYDEPEIGALDCDEIEGHVDMSDDLLLQCVTDFKKEQTIEEYNKEWDRKRLQKLQAEITSSEEELEDLEVQDEKRPKFDCESILSTYSNIYNHPKVIKEPRRNPDKIEINPKTGLPLNALNGTGDNNKLTAKALAKLNNEIVSKDNTGLGGRSLCAESVLSTLSVLSIRPKDETNEEKRERKRLLREYRCERRIERKANAEAFKDEKIRQQKIRINNQRNIQGKTIV